MQDSLGDRIKEYENVTRYVIPRRTYTILRLDGKAFHTYTRNLKKPFDSELSNDIDESVKILLKEIGGARFAYCQSDEISILVTDVDNINTQTWFNGNIQKISSVASSILTAQFNQKRFERLFRKSVLVANTDIIKKSEFKEETFTLAYFDCRTFFIPDRIEVMNYFRWRNQDCRRNSISMVAYSLFSHKSLQGKNSADKIAMIGEKLGKPYEEAFSESERFGRFITKTENGWESLPVWDFSNDEGKLLPFIPDFNY
jgi:tRNA(His) 5'-end guanylyltransferase